MSPKQNVLASIRLSLAFTQNTLTHHTYLVQSSYTQLSTLNTWGSTDFYYDHENNQKTLYNCKICKRRLSRSNGFLQVEVMQIFCIAQIESKMRIARGSNRRPSSYLLSIPKNMLLFYQRRSYMSIKFLVIYFEWNIFKFFNYTIQKVWVITLSTTIISS